MILPTERSPEPGPGPAAIGERRMRPRLLSAAVFKTRGLLMVPLIVAVVVSPGVHAHALNIVLGGGLFALGWWLRVVSQRHLKYRVRLSTPELADSGPYAYVRNPVYLGNVALLAGLLALVGDYWLIAPACAYALLVYHWSVVGFEEIRLTKMFGERYEAYRSRVPRWWPRRPALASAGPSALDTLAALRVEWQCLLLLAAPAIHEYIVHAHIQEKYLGWLCTR